MRNVENKRHYTFLIGEEMEKNKNYDFTGMSIYEYTKELSTPSHIPGGGSVSGICGSFAISLMMMMISISVKSFDESLQRDYDLLEYYRNRLPDLVNEDSKNFDLLMQAFKLPKNTLEEKQERECILQKRYINAAYSPYHIYKIMLELEEILLKYRGLIKQSLSSDLVLMEDLMKSVKRNCIENIEANKLNLETCICIFSEEKNDPKK